MMREKLWMWIAWRLPRPLVLWAAIRLGAHATQGAYSTTVVPNLTFMDAVKRWGVGAITIFLLALPRPVAAQVGTPTSRLAFNQTGPDLTTVQTYVYRLYVDDGTIFILGSVTCSDVASAFVCVTPFPAFTPGAHTIQLTTAIPGVPPAQGESEKSLPFTFKFVIVPSAPTTLRIN